MRAFTESEHALLRIVEQYNQVRKYQGITPEEFLVAFEDQIVDGLLEVDILEKAKLKSFGQKVKGLRFTPQGLRLWLGSIGRDEQLPVITRAGLVVRDIYLYNRLSYTDEAMPKSQLLKHHSRVSLWEAFEMGLVAKVKIKLKHREEVKGYIVTGAGYAYLKGNKLL